MRNSFVFYSSWWIAIRNLPRDVQGDVLTAIVEYGLSGETTEQLKPIAKAMLTMAKTQIDVNNQRFENGKKGGRGKPNPNQTETKPEPNQNQTETKPEPNQNQTETKPEPNQNQTRTKPEPNVNVNDNIIKEKSFSKIEKDKKKSEKGFSPPSLSEVKKFVEEKGYNVDAESFIAFYESKGWFIGKNKMKNWRMAVITWSKRAENEKLTGYDNDKQRGCDKRRGTEIVASSPEDYTTTF